MKRKMTPLLTEIDPDILERPPHVMPKVVDLIMGKWQPTSDEQEQFLDHFDECIYCQVALGILMVEELKYDISTGFSHEQTQKFVSRLKDIIHETQTGDIKAYIEVLGVRGEEEANKRFPVFANHLRSCETCQSTVGG